MTRWAGVQNVSRPIDWCQEMSQCTPTMEQVTAATAHQMYHGTRSERSDAIVSEGAATSLPPCTCNYKLWA